MQKGLPLFLLVAGMMLPGNVQAQTPAAKTSTAAKTAPKASPKATHAGAATKAKPPLTLSTEKQKFSYALGMNLGASLHQGEVEVDPDILAQGLKDALAGGKTLLTEDEVKAALTQTEHEVRQRQQAKMQQMGEANKKEGEAFLAANKSKEGVVALPSGLQYKVLTQGTGPKPAPSDTVVCNYRGTLINGTEFDSSYKRGKPVTFPVNGVIKGWQEALPLMPVGSKWQVFVPADLAYGDHAMSPELGPNSTLIFEVELLSIEKKAANAPAANPAEEAPASSDDKK